MLLPVVRTLVDIHTLPVRALPHTLVSIIAVLVGVAAEGVVAAPGLGSAAPPAALIASLVSEFSTSMSRLEPRNC